MTHTPASLLERLRQPNEDHAWGRFVELYTPLIYYWARRIGLQPTDAADLVQDVFAVLVQKLPTFQYDPNHSFRSWLRTVTVNKWREKQRRRSLAVEPLRDDVSASADGDAFWEVEYRQHLTRRILELMQSEFHVATWKACWETVVASRPALEVASELGMSVGAVRAAKCRVLAHLRKELVGLLD